MTITLLLTSFFGAKGSCSFFGYSCSAELISKCYQYHAHPLYSHSLFFLVIYNLLPLHIICIIYIFPFHISGEMRTNLCNFLFSFPARRGGLISSCLKQKEMEKNKKKGKAFFCSSSFLIHCIIFFYFTRLPLLHKRRIMKRRQNGAKICVCTKARRKHTLFCFFQEEK